MATYIQGVTDYIPQYQPFQPDFNFFAGVIQKKQQQYDQNWSKLNSVYGKFLNAPLTREDNIKNRDQYFKQSVAAIQKITSMDLSLDQNVQQALQVFSPLYNDKNLIHDMSLTKKAMENFSKLDSLKSCVGEKCDGKYWNEGQLFIQYKLDEYKRASADEALNMSAPDAVPMIDVMKRAYDLAKEFKPVVQETSQGMYIVTRKNGQLVQVPLYEHFKALIGEDPAVKRMYAVDAYVERETFIREAEAKGISREEANQIYARDKYEKYQLLVDDSKKMAETQGASLQNQLDRVNEFLKSVPNINENHPLVQTKQNLEQQIEVNEVNRRSVTDIANNINNGYATTTPSGLSSTPTSPQYTPQGADAIVAFYKMNSDFMDAAIANSAMGAEVKIKADPVALARMREAGANARAEMRERGAWNRLMKEQELKEKEKTKELLFRNSLQIGSEEIPTEFPEQPTGDATYTEKLSSLEKSVGKTKIDPVKSLVQYLETVSESQDPSASVAKTMLQVIGTNNPLTMSGKEYTRQMLYGKAKGIISTPKQGSGVLKGKTSLADIISIIDPLKPGNEGLLNTAFGQTLNRYADELRKTENILASTQVEIKKTNEFNKRVLDKVLLKYVNQQDLNEEDLKNDTKYNMLKSAFLYPNGALKTSTDIANYLYDKYGEGGKKYRYDYLKQFADQGLKAFNNEAVKIIGDPQLGLKVNTNGGLTLDLGTFATQKDGKLAVNKFSIQGENGQTPINMSFYKAYQTDIQPILTKVDQELKGAPKISIGYNPKNLASNTEVDVIKALTRELYDESIDFDSEKTFDVSPLVQIAGSTNKKGYWFKNIPFDIVNDVVSQYTTNDDEAKSLKEKIVNNGFVIYGDADNFQSSLFNTYDVDPRYNLFLSNRDNQGRFSYQEKNRRGDAELNISFDPVMQAYTGTVDYKRFDPITNLYRNNSISVPIENDVVANGASFSQLLNNFDDIMANVTSTNIENILSPELADAE